MASAIARSPDLTLSTLSVGPQKGVNTGDELGRLIQAAATTTREISGILCVPGIIVARGLINAFK